MSSIRVVMRIKDALKKLTEGSEFYNDLKDYPNQNDWLIECDLPNENGEKSFFIVEDTEANRKILIQHTPVDLNK